MAAKPLTTEAIALTEKKMEMALDDIIKLSRKNGGKGKKAQRVSNKSQAYKNGGRAQGNSYKVQNFLDSRSSIRQGVLAKRRSNNAPGNQFPFTTEVARRAVNAPIHKRSFNSYKQRAGPALSKVPVIKAATWEKPLPRQRQTLDARFANINEQKMRVEPQQLARGGFNMNASRRRGQQQRRQQQQRRDNEVVGAGRPFSNYQKYY